MPFYLRIRNPGVCPIQAFTIFGASLSRGMSASEDSWIIGQFGSGTKHAVALCLRYIDEEGDNQPNSPIVFCGQHQLEFFTKPQEISDGTSTKYINVVHIKHSGIDQETGKRVRGRIERTSNSIDYGVQDWKVFDLALREFVSNALDMAFRLHCAKLNIELDSTIGKLVKTVNPVPAWKTVTVDIVSDVDIKGEQNFTNVYIKLTPIVQRFYESIGRWFLHFSEIETIIAAKSTVLTKTMRNLPRKLSVPSYARNETNGERVVDHTMKSAVIYRKGVMVREIGEDRLDWDDKDRIKPSLFDYNLNNIRIDEARKVSDSNAEHAAAAALGRANDDIVRLFLQAMLKCQDGGNTNTEKYWEFTFGQYSFAEDIKHDHLTPEVVAAKERWQKIAAEVFGENYCFCELMLAGAVQNKGYLPVICPEGLKLGLADFGCRTDRGLLNDDDRAGRITREPHWWLQYLLQLTWQGVARLLYGKRAGEIAAGELTMPSLVGYIIDPTAPSHKVEAGSRISSFYYGKQIYISHDKFKIDGANEQWPEAQRLLLEGIAHHITGAPKHHENYWQFFAELSLTAVRMAIKPETASAVTVEVLEPKLTLPPPPSVN